HSPFGLSVRGVRESGKRMPAIGAPVAKRLRAIYTLGAAAAGIAGALLAQTTQFVGIDTLGFPRSAELLIMLVLGGAAVRRSRRGRDLHRCAGLPVRHRSGLLAILDRLPAGPDRALRARRHPGRPRRVAQ